MSDGAAMVVKCQNEACGMRFPAPVDHPPSKGCPLCDAPTVQVDIYPSAPALHAEPAGTGSIVAVLDNIRSALNVGTMLRSADGSALDHMYLGGLTAAADNPKVAKTALGAETSVATTSWLDTVDCVASLRRRGYHICAIELTGSSVPLTSIGSVPLRLAFVVGNEKAGVDPAILRRADSVAHLVMRGTKSTLNVGVAFGIAAHWFRSLPLA